MVLTKEDDYKCISTSINIIITIICWIGIIFSYILWIEDTPIYEMEIDILKRRLGHLENNLTTILEILTRGMNATRTTNLN